MLAMPENRAVADGARRVYRTWNSRMTFATIDPLSSPKEFSIESWEPYSSGNLSGSPIR